MSDKTFNAKETKDNIVAWIKELFETDGYKDSKGVVLGISGGKDSAVVAALCVEALGDDRVHGIIMPNGEMDDYADACHVSMSLNLWTGVFDLNDTFKTFRYFSPEALINVAPRLRMTYLYAYAQTYHLRVAGTSNLSERTVGYFTKWGDNACDFNPIGNLTCTEVIALGKELNLPDCIINKPPSDGLCGMNDEERFGFTYEELDEYIRGCDVENSEKISDKEEKSEHKRTEVPMFRM